jgi:hypothetical protein
MDVRPVAGHIIAYPHSRGKEKVGAEPEINPNHQQFLSHRTYHLKRLFESIVYNVRSNDLLHDHLYARTNYVALLDRQELSCLASLL